jgi:uncharacterized membrane protein YkvA (DUF1232 family)
MEGAVGVLEDLKSRAKKMKGELVALYLAFRDPRTPWQARLILALVVGYAMSPVDLIPDFVPILGYLDDLLLLPLGIALAIRLVPPEVMQESRSKAQTWGGPLPVSAVAGFVIASIWILVAAWVALWIWSGWHSRSP